MTTLEHIVATLRHTLINLDEAGTQTQRDTALGEQGKVKSELARLTRERQENEQKIADLFSTRQMSAPSALTSEVVMVAWPLVARVTIEEAEQLKSDLEERSRQLYAARQRERELARELGQSATPLGIDECQQKVDELRENRDICLKAREFLHEARDRIARHVLPITERNMQPLLQQLTSGRYRDVRLTPEETNGQPGEMDYRIRVWDPAAGRFVAKNLFSGGTRDQCSLALRLAFALATLPQELGVAPGFIFLDEPLSAFDAQRAQALVELLTTGTIAQQFSQVVLISHYHAFDRQAFHYHVRMEAGQIAESDLPSGAAVEALFTTQIG
jgi:DNA repair exonuclease SbcCD ATPase subunit